MSLSEQSGRVKHNIQNRAAGLLRCFLFVGSAHMKSYLGIFCLFSTYLDTLFCNLALLHAFVSGLDSYTRLSRAHPNTPDGALSVSVSKPPRTTTTWLKIGSPWFISGLLATAQLAISDRGMARLSGDCDRHFLPAFTNQLEATCLITDSNFLILRTSIAYAVPLIGCLVLTGLQVRCVRRLKFVPSSSYILESRPPPSRHPILRRDVTLETLAPISHSDTLETVHECPRHGRVAYTATAAESVISADENRFPEQVAAADQWYRAYRGEQMAVAINMVSCIVAVGVWSPLILSSLAYGLCHVPESRRLVQQPLYRIPGLDLSKFRPSKCFIHVVESRLADFRWWVYASTGLLLPLALLLMDRGLRRACWRSLGLQNTQQTILTDAHKSPEQHHHHDPGVEQQYHPVPSTSEAVLH